MHQLGAHPCTLIFALYNGLKRQALRLKPHLGPKKSLVFSWFVWSSLAHNLCLLVRSKWHRRSRAHACYFFLSYLSVRRSSCLKAGIGSPLVVVRRQALEALCRH